MDSIISSYVIVAFIGAILSFLALRLTREKKIEEDAAVLATIINKLDYTIKAVDSLVIEMESKEKNISDLFERIAKIEGTANRTSSILDGISKNG